MTQVKRVCIIDDDKIYVHLLERLILKNELAAELKVFPNGKEAFDYFLEKLHNLETTLPEVILLDLNMPLMDGWEFLDAIAPYEGDLKMRGVQLYVVSSTINPKEVAEICDNDLVKDFITKPVSLEVLRTAFNNRVVA